VANKCRQCTKITLFLIINLIKRAANELC